MKKLIQSTLCALLLCTMGSGLVNAMDPFADVNVDPFAGNKRQSRISPEEQQRRQASLETEHQRRRREAQAQPTNSFANEGFTREETQQQREYKMDTDFENKQSDYWKNRHVFTKIGHWFDRFSDEKTAKQALHGNPDALQELTDTVQGWKNDPDRTKKIDDIRSSVIKDLVQQHNAIDAGSQKVTEFKTSAQRVLYKKALELIKLLDSSDSTTPTKVEVIGDNVHVTTGHNTVLIFDGKTGKDVTEQYTNPAQRENPFVSTPAKGLTSDQFTNELQRLKIRTTTNEFATLTSLNSKSKGLLIEHLKNNFDTSDAKQKFVETFIKLATENENATVKISTEDLIKDADTETRNQVREQRELTSPFGKVQTRGLQSASPSEGQPKPVTKVSVPDTTERPQPVDEAQQRFEKIQQLARDLISKIEETKYTATREADNSPDSLNYRAYIRTLDELKNELPRRIQEEYQMLTPKTPESIEAFKTKMSKLIQLVYHKQVEVTFDNDGKISITSTSDDAKNSATSPTVDTNNENQQNNKVTQSNDEFGNDNTNQHKSDSIFDSNRITSDVDNLLAQYL